MRNLVVASPAALLFLSLSMLAVAQKQIQKQDANTLIPLDKVIQQVQSAVDEYQNNLGQGSYALPPLSSVEFDFKTTTGKTVSGSVSLFIIKFGASRERDTINDVTYTYAPKQPSAGNAELQSNERPPTLKDELAKTIQTAAQTVSGALTAAGLPFKHLTVNIQYGVKWDVNGAASPSISFVTIDLGGDINRNQVQSVKLVFGS